MIKKLLKTLFKTGKTATSSTNKGLEFIDEVLEKEYIVSAVDNLKVTTGKIVEQAGVAYQQTKMAVEKNVDLDKVQKMGDKVVSKAKETIEGISENLQDVSPTIKSVMDEGEKMVDSVLKETGLKAKSEEEE